MVSIEGLLNHVDEPFGVYAPQGIFRTFVWMSRTAERLKAPYFVIRIIRRVAFLANRSFTDTVFRGCKFRLLPYQNYGDGKVVFSPLTYDKVELDYIIQSVDADSLFVDVGANVGLYTCIVGKNVRSGGKIVSVEPNPQALVLLRRNIDLNGISDIVEVLPVGVGDADGIATLHLHAKNLGGSSLQSDLNTDAIQIDVTMMLGVISRYDRRVTVLKIDVEGLETRIFEKFFSEASSNLYPLSVVVEACKPGDPLYELFLSNDYEIVYCGEMNSIFRYKMC